VGSNWCHRCQYALHIAGRCWRRSQVGYCEEKRTRTKNFKAVICVEFITISSINMSLNLPIPSRLLNDTRSEFIYLILPISQTLVKYSKEEDSRIISKCCVSRCRYHSFPGRRQSTDEIAKTNLWGGSIKRQYWRDAPQPGVTS
jgi:hypothetical protein